MKTPALINVIAAASTLANVGINLVVDARIPDRGRIFQERQQNSNIAKQVNSKLTSEAAIEGPRYRAQRGKQARQQAQEMTQKTDEIFLFSKPQAVPDTSKMAEGQHLINPQTASSTVEFTNVDRQLGSQLTGCCSTYQSYSAETMCSKYGANCSSGGKSSRDNGGSCTTNGLSFIGLSFSVNTARGNPYSYQLCDQFPMENIIDRDYDYVMSMDEDGWLVGGGYKTFDYSGKMPYIDSSHTELLRVGNMDPNNG